MSNLNIFCFGFGQVAKTFIQKLKLENFNINLSTTSRKKTRTLKFDNINYTSFQFEDDDYDIDINNFFKVCPKEMLDTLENPITANFIAKEVS